MASWRTTEENQTCACCANGNYIPNNYKVIDNRIIINHKENLCHDCTEFWCTCDGQTLLKERLQIHEGKICNLCEKKVNEELRGLGPIYHHECLTAIDNFQHNQPIITRPPLSETEIEKINNITNSKLYKSIKNTRIQNPPQFKKKFKTNKTTWKPGPTKWSWVKTT